MKNLYLIEAGKPFPGYVESTIYRAKDNQLYVNFTNGLYEGFENRNLTLQEYRDLHPDQQLKIIDDAKLDQLLTDYDKTLITLPSSITEDRFQDMLEILPPQRWHNCGGFEVFHIQEHITGDIVSWFAHRGDQYFEFVDSCYISDADLTKKLFTAIDS